jgi:hypothetical protein
MGTFSISIQEINAAVSCATEINIRVSQSHRWKATERTINANVTAAKNKLNRNPNDAECRAQLEYAQALQDECLEDSAIGRDHKLWPLRVKSFYAQLKASGVESVKVTKGKLRLYPFEITLSV